MLDTDISSYIIKRRPATLIEKFEKHADALCVSVITAAELRFGAEKAGRPQLTELVEAYLERLAVLDWINEVSGHYARIRSLLERSRKPIGNTDLLIASHAVAQRMILVTNNLKHFSSVPDLKVRCGAERKRVQTVANGSGGPLVALFAPPQSMNELGLGSRFGEIEDVDLEPALLSDESGT
jgi:tRNA(fMet)-specific endonuclease VapC